MKKGISAMYIFNTTLCANKNFLACFQKHEVWATILINGLSMDYNYFFINFDFTIATQIVSFPINIPLERHHHVGSCSKYYGPRYILV